MEKYKKISYSVLLGALFFLGVFLRTRLYITNNVFEDDECRLIISMLDKNFWQVFLPLGYAQSAPPVFVFCSKILGVLFSYSERALKFIPYISGISALYMLYLFCKDYFSKKLSVLICLFLCAVNHNYIAFSTIFKQYSTDILFSLICLYFLPKINIVLLNTKKMILLGIILILLPLISLPSVFFITAFVIINIFINLKDKNFYKKLTALLIPFIIIMSLYYTFNLLPSKVDINTVFPNYWDSGFWKFSIKDFIRILAFNFKFDFMPNNLLLCQLILFFLGIFTCILDKSKKRNISLFMLIALACTFGAALFNIYPLSGRVGLFISPLFIILMITPLDKAISLKPTYWTTILLIILSFYNYSPAWIMKYKDASNIFKHSPRTMMLELKEHFDPNKDIILCNSASASSYVFYSNKYKFSTDNIYEMKIKPVDEYTITEYFNNLKKNQRYWLFIIKDYKRAQMLPYIKKWLENKKILYSKQERNSYLIYFEN